MSKNIGKLAGFKQNIAASQTIDLSEKTKTAKVVREGFEVPQPQLNKNKAVFAIENLVIVPPKAMPRVVSQSVPAGTRVPPGTVIDFVIVPKTDIPFNIFENVHDSLAARTLDQVDDLLENVAVREVLLKRESVSEVTPAEKAILATAFKNKNIEVDDAQPGKTFEKAFNSVRGAVAFR